MAQTIIVFLARMSAFTASATIWASAETTYESEAGTGHDQGSIFGFSKCFCQILKPMSILQMTPKVL